MQEALVRMPLPFPTKQQHIIQQSDALFGFSTPKDKMRSNCVRTSRLHVLQDVDDKGVVTPLSGFD